VTKRQQKALQRYVNELCPMLGISDWNAVVQQEPPENSGHDGAHRSIPGTRTSTLRFGEKFFGFEPEYQREVVVHELLHCVFAPEQDQVRHVLPDYFKGPAGELFRDLWFQAHEYAIDTLAVAFGRRLPLPELPR